MTELKQFKLPDVGEGLTEADIVKWHVQPGDRVTINQVIVEIETAKAVVELPSPFEGVVADLLAAEGTTVDVGTPILSVSTGEGAAEPAAAGAAPAGTAAPAAGTRRLRDRGRRDRGPPRRPRSPLRRPAAASGDPRAGAAALPAADAVAGTEESAPREERQAVLVGYGVKLGRTTRRARKPAAAGQAGQATARPPWPRQPRGRPRPRCQRRPAAVPPNGEGQRRAAPAPAPWPSRRCASSPATSAWISAP